jgi:hypothetical protein
MEEGALRARDLVFARIAATGAAQSMEEKMPTVTKESARGRASAR